MRGNLAWLCLALAVCAALAWAWSPQAPQLAAHTRSPSPASPAGQEQVDFANYDLCWEAAYYGKDYGFRLFRKTDHYAYLAYFGNRHRRGRLGLRAGDEMIDYVIQRSGSDYEWNKGPTFYVVSARRGGRQSSCQFETARESYQKELVQYFQHTSVSGQIRRQMEEEAASSTPPR